MANSDKGKLTRYVWEESGTLADYGGDPGALRDVQSLIAQAMLNRLDIANGRVGVFGKDGVFYWGNGEDGNPNIRPVTQLGFGGIGTTMSKAIDLADANVGAVDANGELNSSHMAMLRNTLNTDLGDISRPLQGRLPVLTVNKTYVYVTAECYRVIAAMQGTNAIMGGTTYNQPGFFVTNWKGRGGISNPDPARLFDLGNLGVTRFWGFVEFYRAQYPYPPPPPPPQPRRLPSPRPPTRRGSNGRGIG